MSENKKLKKKKSESSLIFSQRMLPQDANPAGNVHGGRIVMHIDTVGGTVAARHCRMNVVTVSIDRMEFLCPVYVGELVTLKGSINYVGRTSLEVGVRVEAENILTGNIRYTNTAYLTFVALDKEGKPTEVPGIILESATDRRRWDEAEQRRIARKQERTREKKASPIKPGQNMSC